MILCLGPAGFARAEGVRPPPRMVGMVPEGRGPTWHAERLTHQSEQGGDHWRFETWNGPVHVWRPSGYDPATAGTVVYVHGYYVDVDTAWRKHRLAAQFVGSGLNALFIAPEAPSGGHQEVFWPGLGMLLVEVEKHVALTIPPGPLVAVGHSGAYRTLTPWLDYKPLERVILLDGLYDYEDQFEAWLKERGRQALRRKMTLVATRGTRERSLKLVAALRRLSATSKAIPEAAGDFTRKHLAARLLHVKSQYGHFELVTEGKAIPVLLGATSVPRL
jgi:hypothetical protein